MEKRKTYVKKNVDARGSWLARREGTDVGFDTSWGRAAMMPDETVTTKKPCYIGEVKRERLCHAGHWLAIDLR